jgi:hypothetical protein
MFDFEKKYWDYRYKNGHNSGYGSYGEQLKKKLKWLSNLDINSISEIGCGDLNFMKNLVRESGKELVYSGQDISDVIIKKNREVLPKVFFTTNIDELPSADLLLCVDVLFHVIEDSEYEDLLNKIQSKWTKYLAITAYERKEPKYNHVRIRKFPVERFGTPIIREIVEENGELYFYLFKK